MVYICRLVGYLGKLTLLACISRQMSALRQGEVCVKGRKASLAFVFRPLHKTCPQDRGSWPGVSKKSWNAMEKQNISVKGAASAITTADVCVQLRRCPHKKKERGIKNLAQIRGLEN